MNEKRKVMSLYFRTNPAFSADEAVDSNNIFSINRDDTALY